MILRIYFQLFLQFIIQLMSQFNPRHHFTHRHYPYSYGPHLHAQLTAIHHGELLREQAEIDRFSRTNRQLYSHDRVAEYEMQIREKEMRIADMLGRSKLIASLQSLKMNDLKYEDELRHQQILRQMEVDRYLLLNKSNYPNTGRSQLKDQDERIKIMRQYHCQQGKSQSLPHKEVNKQEMSQTARSQVKNKQPQELMNNYHSAILGSSKLLGENSKRNKKKNRVSFDLQPQITINKPLKYEQDSPQPLKSKSYKSHRYPSQPKKQNHHPPSSSKQNATKRIQNRMKLSSMIYKDSQWKNIKHELVHLFSTYQNQLRLRNQLRKKINNNPKVIESYKIVVDAQ